MQTLERLIGSVLNVGMEKIIKECIIISHFIYLLTKITMSITSHHRFICILYLNILIVISQQFSLNFLVICLYIYSKFLIIVINHKVFSYKIFFILKFSLKTN